jgi:hypothetical protein
MSSKPLKSVSTGFDGTSLKNMAYLQNIDRRNEVCAAASLSLSLILTHIFYSLDEILVLLSFLCFYLLSLSVIVIQLKFFTFHFVRVCTDFFSFFFPVLIIKLTLHIYMRTPMCILFDRILGQQCASLFLSIQGQEVTTQ